MGYCKLGDCYEDAVTWCLEQVIKTKSELKVHADMAW
jgi:hypothetical protein